MSGEQAFNPKFLLPESVFTRRVSGSRFDEQSRERISSGNCMQQTAAGTADSGDFDRVEIEGRIVQRKKYYVVYIKEEPEFRIF